MNSLSEVEQKNKATPRPARATSVSEAVAPLYEFIARLRRAHDFRAPVREVTEIRLGKTSELKMSNALATTNEYQPVDGWDAAATDTSASPVKGSILKFDNGAFFLGKEKELIEDDKEFVAIDVAEGWQFLKKDCQPEFSMRRLGEPKPPRPDSYSDKSTWPTGLDGNPADPWKYSRFLYLIDPLTAETFTFSSSSVGGQIGISDLTSQIRLMRNARPGAVPIIAPSSRQMSTKFGKKPRPFFLVKGWRVRDEGQPRLIESGDDGSKTVSPYDDDLPF
jgi:hypothetical protein